MELDQHDYGDYGLPEATQVLAPLSASGDITFAADEPPEMSVSIRNARIFGQSDLVKIICDTVTGRIVSVTPESSAGQQALLTNEPGPSRRTSPLLPAETLGVDDMVLDAAGSLVLPGLVHGHIHLDKPYLLDRCTIVEGNFAEAMTKTQEAKRNFEYDDLLSRGRQLVRASIAHGVTAMRAHVEVDPTVALQCLEVGLQLKSEFATSCDIKLVVFAQDSIFTCKYGSPDTQYTEQMKELLETALQRGHRSVSAIGSAPYVEKNGKSYELSNIRFILDLAEKYAIDADFHLDFDVSRDSRLMDLIDEVAQRPAFHSRVTTPARRSSMYPLRVTLGHCRTLSRIEPANIYRGLAAKAHGLEIYIIGLPNSDMYMKHANEPSLYRDTPRTILNALELERQSTSYLRGRVSLAVNNVGNLFTPHGDGDPLGLLPLCVAVYQDATEKALASLLRMVTVQAARAAGLRPSEHAADLAPRPGEPADFVVLDGCTDWRMAALAPPAGRTTLKGARIVGKRKVETWIEGDSGIVQ